MKKLMVIFVLLSINFVSFCQDIYYSKKDDILYGSYEPMFNEVGKISKGEQICILEGGVTYDVEGVYRTKVRTKDGKIGWLSIDTISVIDSEILPNEITKNSWIHSYYLDVLQNGNRETLFVYEPFWRDAFYKYKDMDAMYPEDEKTWYDIAAWVTRFDFKTIYSKIRDLSNANYYDLINGKISKIGGIFYFSVVCTDIRITFEETEMEKYFPLNEKCFMALSLDGDYLDVFINDKKNFTLVKLNEEIEEQFEMLIKTNTCDLSKVQWPKRAPKQLNAGEECRVLENLRLRASPDTASAVKTTLEQGNKVTILEIGQNTTIDGVTAPWVKVQTTAGENGWCFGLYLRETRFEPTPEELMAMVNSNVEKTENVDSTVLPETAEKKFPLWVILVGGIFVLLAGGVVLFVVKRKR